MGPVLKLGELMSSVTYFVNFAHCYEKMIILQLVYRKHKEIKCLSIDVVLKLMFHCCSHCYGKHEMATCTQKQQSSLKQTM